MRVKAGRFALDPTIHRRANFPPLFLKKIWHSERVCRDYG